MSTTQENTTLPPKALRKQYAKVPIMLASGSGMGPLIDIHAYETSTLRELKMAIETAEGTPIEQQRLFLAGR